ncbi:protein PLASTID TRANSCRIPTIONALLY ACTIVE 10 [Silene latifolia]|uniref:protein PLASTID TRANSCRIPTIONALLY ACTIVE 10 n=1 Tax=Silene latifolia TaxID=37657 RepID=UPI003D772903
MQVLQITSQFLSLSLLPKTLLLKPNFHLKPDLKPRPGLQPKLSAPKALASDEFPVDETFLEQYTPKDNETEDEARKRNWVERGWAPWEEILSPEAQFARYSLNEGEEVPLKTPEAIEAFKMLKPSYREKKREEMGLTEDEWDAKQFDIQGEILEPLETTWDGPLVVRHVAPRDWPPRGWEVDRKELEFIREGHKMMSERVDIKELEGACREKEGMSLDRYRTFLKQYQEWVEHNKDRLDEESYEHDQDYHPGRRKRGSDYKEGMYELPFYYPGQICVGKVTTLHLYQGAFIDIGGVHEGWVPIKGNDWYWIRQHIKVGMHVLVEVLAKRDPYRFRFPLELRFVDPNIDHLIFNRFEYPPILHREEDTNPEELRLDCRRPPLPRKDPGIKIEEEPLKSDHPYVDKLWQIHVAEQMMVDDIEANPDKYKGKKLSELTDTEEFDEQHSVEHTKVYYQKSLLPKMTLKTSVKELDLESAFAERQHHNRLEKEAEERGEEYKVAKLRRNIEMDEYDLIHWRRSFEEREALLRDISCRQALGLPLQEPGRYVDPAILGKGQYDPSNPLYRYDYWGEPKNSEKSKQERLTDAHNKSIVGKGHVWYDMSYEEVIEQMKERKANAKDNVQNKIDEVETRQYNEDDDSDSDSDDEFDISILSDTSIEYDAQPHVNGTESSSISDEGMFED